MMSIFFKLYGCIIDCLIHPRTDPQRGAVERELSGEHYPRISTLRARLTITAAKKYLPLNIRLKLIEDTSFLQTWVVRGKIV